MIDMQLFMTKDGDICSVEGWWHPEDKVICNYIYLQHPDGDVEIEGNRYVKVIRKKKMEAGVALKNNWSLLNNLVENILERILSNIKW
jgi:predicted nucleotidyltransferase